MPDYARPILIHQPRRFEFGAGASPKRSASGPTPRASAVLVVSDAFNADRVDRWGCAAPSPVFGAVKPEPDTMNLEAALASGRARASRTGGRLRRRRCMDLAKLVPCSRTAPTLDDVDRPEPRRAGAAPRPGAHHRRHRQRGRHPRARHRHRHADKLAVESPHLLADMVVLDPELTMSVPRAVTAATGVDALAHCVEAFTNRGRIP